MNCAHSRAGREGGPIIICAKAVGLLFARIRANYDLRAFARGASGMTDAVSV